MKVKKESHVTGKTGAQRSVTKGKGRYDCIWLGFPHMLFRLACLFEQGIESGYEPGNWKKGTDLRRWLEGGSRHLCEFAEGLTNEDHLIAGIWNLLCLGETRHLIETGVLPTELDNLPFTPGGIDPSKPVQWEGDSKWGRASLLVDPPNAPPESIVELPTFYVCGPMTGMKDFNFPLFDQVTALARSQGLSVISPAELDREHGIDPSVDPDSVERARRADPNLIQTIVQRDTQVIVGLERDKGDGLILLPGWEKSTGARAEVANAIWMELSFKRVVTTWHGQVLRTPQIEDTDFGWVRLHLFYQTHEDE